MAPCTLHRGSRVLGWKEGRATSRDRLTAWSYRHGAAQLVQETTNMRALRSVCICRSAGLRAGLTGSWNIGELSAACLCFCFFSCLRPALILDLRLELELELEMEL